MLLCFNDYLPQTRALATALGWPLNIIESHRFPDEEIKLKLPTRLPTQVVICQSLDHPNEKLLALLLAAKTLRAYGVQELTLVAPYICYMRQDMAFQPGESISQRIIGQYLADLFDNIITVDPHLHRIQRLEDAIPAKRVLCLTAASLLGAFLAERKERLLILGPDSESLQWVQALATPYGWQHAVCSKKRQGDEKVVITLPELDFNGASVVLVDDMASSGTTLSVAVAQCLARGASRVDVLVTHALFVHDAMERIALAGAQQIWSTDSITHATNRIPLCYLLKDALLSLPSALVCR